MKNILCLNPIKLDESLVEVYKGNPFLYDFIEPKIMPTPITITDSSEILIKHHPMILDEMVDARDFSNISIDSNFNDEIVNAKDYSNVLINSNFSDEITFGEHIFFDSLKNTTFDEIINLDDLQND